MKKEPLVLCLTNTVAANFTANCLLAIGAKPAMIEEPSEAAELAAVADAMLVNVGTATASQATAMREAVRVACRRSLPWVLDPVGIQHLSFRRELVRELLEQKPSLVRCNRAELAALPPAASVILATGETDEIREPGRPPSAVGGGVPMLRTVTATGCAQGGLCAAFLGRGLSPIESALTGSRLMKQAGEAAWRRAQAPGGFQAALLDALWELSHD